MDLAEDREPQNPVQDNMENYRKLLSLGKQLLVQSLEHFVTLLFSSCRMLESILILFEL